jgi:hypothetical protein
MSLSFNFPISKDQELFANEVGDKFSYTLPAIPGNYTVLLLNLLTNKAHFLSINNNIILNYVPATDPGKYVFFIFESTGNPRTNLIRDNFTEQIKLTELGKVVIKIPFTVLKSLVIPGDIKRKAVKDLGIDELYTLCKEDPIFRQQTCMNDEFLIGLINKYLLSDPSKAREYYLVNKLNFGKIRQLILEMEDFISGRGLTVDITQRNAQTGKRYNKLEQFDIPLRKLGMQYPSPLINSVFLDPYYNRDKERIGAIIPYLTQSNLKLLLKQIFENTMTILRHRRREIEDMIIQSLDTATFNDIFNRAIPQRHSQYFQALLRNVAANERDQYQQMYDEYNGLPASYSDLPDLIRDWDNI